MLAPLFSYFHMNRFLNYAVLGMGILFLGASALVFTNRNRADFHVTFLESLPKEKVNYSEVGNGAIGLKGELPLLPIPDLHQEILFLGLNERPDSLDTDEKIVLIGLKSSLEKKEIKLGHKAYLHYDLVGKNTKGVLRFSEESTPLWIRAVNENEATLHLEVGLSLPLEQREILEDKVSLDISLLPREIGVEKREPLSLLKEAKYWGHDRLYDIYGGEEDSDYKDKERLEFLYDDGPKVIFLGMDDFLSFKDNRWELVKLGVESRGKPLARVSYAVHGKIEIEVWDEKGFFKSRFSYSSQQAAALSLKKEEIFSKVRLRTPQMVSCFIGKRRLLLRKGDWLLHTKGVWRVLKRANEIEDYLSFKLKGELFIFDKVERRGNKSILMGHLFDPMRLVAQSIEVTIVKEKAQNNKTGESSQRTPMNHLPAKREPQEKGQEIHLQAHEMKDEI